MDNSFPPHMRLHLVFHASLLEPYTTSSNPPPPIEFLEGPEFEVVAILYSKIVWNKLYYLVDWVSYTPNDRTWEPVGNLANVVDMVTTFHRQYPNKPGPSTNHTTCDMCRRRKGIVSWWHSHDASKGFEPTTFLYTCQIFNHSNDMFLCIVFKNII